MPRFEPLVKVGLTPRDNYRVQPPSGTTIKIAHISDTHLGLSRRTVYVPSHNGTAPVKRSVASFQAFGGIVRTIEALDPDLIIHTGDVLDFEIRNKRQQYEQLLTSLPELSPRRLFLYIRGNHDTLDTGVHVGGLFDDWNVLSLEDSGPVPLADGQLLVHGLDYRAEPTDTRFDCGDVDEETILIGAFHQSMRQISRSYRANVDLNDLSPSSDPPMSYYDILLFGHMHTDYLEQHGECLVLDGGSALGLETVPTVGLFTFSSAGTHYQKFPLWLAPS